MRSLFSRRRRAEAAAAMLDRRRAIHAPTVPPRLAPQPYQTGTVSQVVPHVPERAARRLCLPPVMEEPVDGRPGAADVGAEGAVPEQRVRER